MQAIPRLRALIIGDSYIYHLMNFIVATSRSQNFGLQDIDVSFEYVRGGTVLRVQQKLHSWLEEYQPHILIVQLGANDLCAQHAVSWSVADQLVTLGQQALNNYGVIEVVFGTAFDRTCYPKLLPRYPMRILQFNRWMKAVLSQEAHMTYWRHARTVMAADIMAVDGVHLNDRGNTKLYKSLRSVLIRLAKQLSQRSC